MTIADRIKELRKQRRYTQKDLAELMNVKPTTVSGWELARNEPSIDSVKQLAKVFGVSTDYLTGSEVENSSAPTTTDLDAMLDNARSFDGKPMSQHDRDVIRSYLQGRFSD